MNAMKFGGRVILMTAVALVLATLALSLPLYTVKSVQVLYSGETTTTYRDFYIDYYGTSGSFGDLRPYADWDMNTGIKEVMDLEETLIFAWLAVGLAFLSIVILQFWNFGILFGWTLVGISLLAVIQFAAWIEEAVRNAGMMGEYATSGPAIGFLLIIMAMILQILAVLAYTYVTYPILPRIPHGR